MIYATVPLQFRFNSTQTNKRHSYNFDQNVPIGRKGNLPRIQLGKTFIDHNLLNRLIPRGIAGLYFQDSRGISLTFFAPVKVSIILFFVCFCLFFFFKKRATQFLVQFCERAQTDSKLCNLVYFISNGCMNHSRNP